MERNLIIGVSSFGISVRARNKSQDPGLVGRERRLPSGDRRSTPGYLAAGQAMNVADYIIAFLGSLGVRHIFGYPGSPLVPLLAALQRQDVVSWVLMRHENAAAMAAGAHARLTGELGVCAATSGPGALNAICGVIDADLDRVPVLAITGQVPTAQVGHWDFQDVNQAQLFGAALAHSASCIHSGQLVALLRNFVGRARQQQRAVHLALPSDVLETELAVDDAQFSLDLALLPRPLVLMPPPAAALDLVARELENFRLPVVVIGRRALGCGSAIEQLAEKLGAPIITSLDGKGIVDEFTSECAGSAGRLRLSRLPRHQADPSTGRRHPRHRRRYHQAVPHRTPRRTASSPHPVRVGLQLSHPRIPSHPHLGRSARCNR